MPSTYGATASPPALAPERRALLAGDQIPLVDFVPLLRRSNFDVRRTRGASGALRLVREVPFDLVVVVLPCPDLAELLAAVREPTAPCRHAAVLLVGANGELHDERVTRLANRVLPAQVSAEELEKAVAAVLDVAPRIDMRGAVRVRLGQLEEEARLLRLENVSTSGMLLAGREALPVGSLFGFELQLPDQPIPILGQARVVRHTQAPRSGEQGIGASFVTVGGEGVERLRSAIVRERAGALQATRTATPAAAPRSGAAGAVDPEELEMQREELAEMSAFLDDLLRGGLSRRLGVADWYVTGVELGLESLASFVGILETVYRGQSGPPESSRRIADLVAVRSRLAQFAQQERGIAERVDILVEIRPVLERLMRELSETTGDDRSAATARRGAVAQLAHDVGRATRARRSLANLQALLSELQHPRYLFARGTLRRHAEAICQQYRGYGTTLGLERSELLLDRRGRAEALARTQREAQRTEEWLLAIHRKVYPPKLRRLATGDFDVDFAEERLLPVLSQTLAAGYEYLVRAYGAYQHALEMSGADAGLLGRVASLAASIAESERAGARAAQRQAAAR
jgi:hypothetical protein